MCIEDEDFIGNIYLENDQIDQDQQSIFLNTNSNKVSMNIHTHDYDDNGKIIQTYQVFIPIRYAFLGPVEVGTKQLNSNSPDDDVISASRSSKVEVSIRYC